MNADPETRTWRLRGYAGKELLHDRQHHGDAALNKAIAHLENNPDITRITAAPA